MIHGIFYFFLEYQSIVQENYGKFLSAIFYYYITLIFMQIYIQFGMLFNYKIIGNLFQRGYIVTTSLNIDFYANSRQSVFDFNAIPPRLIF